MILTNFEKPSNFSGKMGKLFKKRRNIKKHLKKRANYKKGFHNYSFLNAEKYGTITEEEMAVFKNPMYTPGTVTNGTIQEINTNEEFIQLSD